MDRAPPTPSRKAEFPWAISSRLGGYEHVETLPPDDGRPRLTTRTHSIPRKPLPKTSKVSTAEISSNQSSTCSVSDADFDRKPSEELHRDSALYLAFSVVTALVPCLFIALAIIAARLEGTPTSEWGGKVQNALLLVPTIYPVLFAALVSKSLRSFALILAARTTTLGRLEQLMGSGTVGGTLMTAVLLRLLNITTVLLLLLWAMSPLGGQGALRMLYTKTVPITRSSVTVWYLNSDTEPWVSSASGMGKVLPRVDAIFMSAILAPDDARSGPVDIYGKIKIPRIETMETSDTPEDGWFTVNPAKVRFSSLVGAPFQMFPKANASGNGSFNMETSYFHFDCEKIDKLSKRMVPRPALAALLSKGPNGMSRSMLLNDTEATYTSSRTASRKGVLEPRRLEFLSTMGSGFDEAINETSRHFAYTQCSMTTTFVESRVACVDQRCEVVAVRRSRRPHEPEHLTVLDGAGIAISANFYSRFSISGATGSGDQYTPAQHYLANTENSMSVSENLRIVPDIAAIDKTTFSERLGVLFNTYWTIFQAPHSITTTPQKIAIADTPADKPLIPQGQAPTLPGHMKTANSSAPFLAEKAPAEFVRYEEQYACTWYWLTCFGLSALVLTIISIIGVICQFLRIAPDIFYISGLTRDTPYVNVEGQGAMSTLDGSYKARPLRNMRVVIADVKPDEKVGKVALIAVDERMGEKVDRWEKLRWKRRYQ